MRFVNPPRFVFPLSRVQNISRTPGESCTRNLSAPERDLPEGNGRIRQPQTDGSRCRNHEKPEHGHKLPMHQNSALRRSLWGDEMRCHWQSGLWLRLYRSDEAIPRAGFGFDVPRMFGRISKRQPQAVYRCVQPTFKIHEGVVRPEPRLQLIARDNLAGTFQQRTKDVHRFRLQPNSSAVLAEFPGSPIQLEYPKLNHVECTSVRLKLG